MSAAGRDLLPALTGLRFFAALHVVAHHLRSSKLVDFSPWPVVDRFVERGGTAVGLFFVLSGFILAYTYGRRDAERRTTPWAFYRARFARIYPVYLFGLLVTAPFFLGQMSRAGFGFASPTTWYFGGLAAGLLQAWVPEGVLLWNPPGWSLSAEAFFYALFPALLAVLRGRSRGTLVVVATLAWIVALFPTTVALYATDAVRQLAGRGDGWIVAVLKYNPLLRCPEFVFGAALGLLYLRRPAADATSPRVVDGLATDVAAVAVVAALACLPAALGRWCPNVELFIHNGLLAPLFGLLIWRLAIGGGATSRVLSTGPLLLLGEASYALYLLHTPVILYLRTVGIELRSHPWPREWIAVGATLASVLVSVIVYVRLEVPARRRLRGGHNAPSPAFQ